MTAASGPRSIGDYAILFRIERAKLLLETSDMSIQDISDALGFSTRSYFSQCFREVTGMTPKGYQQKNT